jgi:2-succinyl-5-enolpyruvyl-6-hydroxy-3-cyclohexene-1-carboxylate synthase
MTATDTYLLLRAFCDELARCGMTDACTAPGSRNTPIVLSLAREPRIACASHIDERCAGFYALGLAKASGRPVAVTCTSGTAAANLAPAVIEAREARVPLLVLTADRPPELRDIGAGQTIDQLKLYGDAVKWFFEVGGSEASDAALRWMRTLACRAYLTTLDGRPGPVHLNLPLREPLVLDSPLPADRTGRPDGAPYVRMLQPAPAPAPSTPVLCPPRTVIVCGREERELGAASELAAVAARLGIPLLADPLSGARRGPAAIAHYDLLLRDPGFGDAHRPELVIRVGDLPTSKPLRGWLAALDAPQLATDPDGVWHDPGSLVGTRAPGPVSVLLGGLSPERAGAPEPGWLAGWREADARAGTAIDVVLGDGLSEPRVAIELARALPPEASLFVAASMPVRDVEEFWPVLHEPPRVLANRGANGIDGTVSSAFGVAAASDGPVALLIGDVALAHDLGGLLAARRLGTPLAIVVLHNDGGGIFHFLPVASEGETFEEHVATPHGLDFAHAAALFGCRFARPRSVGELREALAASLAAETTTIVEVRTDRIGNRELHARVAAAAAAAL